MFVVDCCVVGFGCGFFWCVVGLFFGGVECVGLLYWFVLYFDCWG